MTEFDFGLRGKRALVCGSSQGLGLACAEALLRGGADVTINGRDTAKLDRTMEGLAGVGSGSVSAVTADLSTEQGRAAMLAACPGPDILVTNAGGPPPGDLDDWGEDEWFDALRTSMVAPIGLMKACLPVMRERRWGRIINITSMAVKMPLPRLGLSNGARSGLTGFVAGLSREVAGDGVTINNLLPGRFGTTRLQSYLADQADAEGVSVDEVLKRQGEHIPAGRIGRPEEFGAFCLFLASEQAAYMTGQNILLDGGEYPGAL